MKVRLLHVALVALSLFNIFSLDASDVVLAINAGGSAYTSSFGFSYSSDVYYTSGLSNNAVAGAHVAHTLDENIYLSERSDSVTWGYDIPISTDGKYVLILQFAEISFSSANSRVFTIQVGDYLVAYQTTPIAFSRAAEIHNLPTQGKEETEGAGSGIHYWGWTSKLESKSGWTSRMGGFGACIINMLTSVFNNLAYLTLLQII